ncbi:MAG: sodium/solute symporter [Opitutales bacterium]|nr:sodium/solute symporter [Opitutales bacterium]
MPLFHYLRIALAQIIAGSALLGSGLGEVFHWQELPVIPDPVGFAAPFAGVVDGALVVAGGANFPDARPWAGGTRTWHDRAFVLDHPGGEWRVGGTLPAPIAYGVSITLPEGLLCVGGSGPGGHVSDVYLLRMEAGELAHEPLASLPLPLANASGVQVGSWVYVFGGIASPTAKPENRLWGLDLSNRAGGWVELPPLPGRPRMLATAGALRGHLYIFGGVDLLDDPATGGLVREYLHEAWRFSPRSGWERLADMPVALTASPSPAPPAGTNHLLVLGGDDGALAAELLRLKDDHPGFPDDIWAYHVVTNTWTTAGKMPRDPGPDPANDPNSGLWPPVTIPVVAWEGMWVIPGGEGRPGVRTPRVIAAKTDGGRSEVGTLNMTVLVIYLLAMLGIGFYFSRKERSTERFFRGSQSLPWWAVGLSIYATMLSAITFMAIPAKAFTDDWSYFFANVAILAVAPVVIGLYLPFFRRLDVTSAYEYLQRRFNTAVRVFGSVSFILLQIGRMAIVLYLPAIALATVSTLDVYTCILLTATLCIIYTMIGGIEAVVWTDVVQTFVLLGGALISLFIVLMSVNGGLPAIFEMATTDQKFFENTVWFSTDMAIASVAVIFFGSFFQNLISYTASQDVVQRYMTTADIGKARRSIWTNALLALPGTAIFFTLGTALYVFYKSQPERLSTGIANDQILPLFIVNELPAGIAGLVIAAIMAASQSTLSSSLNSVAAVWMTDLQPLIRRGRVVADKRNLSMAKGLILIVGVFVTGVACIMASMEIASLWDAFIVVIGLTGGGLGGLFALGIFTRRAHGYGALTGAFASIIVLGLVRTQADISFFLFGAIGMITCFVVGYVVSLLIPARGLDLTGLTIHTLLPKEDSSSAKSG